ncbi:unnamed protein product [Protopolystoma xenopodis]|uniref:PX domain-containing protein n=1 Tax=Protopolystoma xenopodis TaxID=117903 RepID=A0A448WIG7_9PLAT|nr:unnamed protein product [Protopolystoma xenopodis]
MDREELLSGGLFNDTVPIGGPHRTSITPRINVGKNEMEHDPPIQVVLSDATSVEDTTCLPQFRSKEFSVQRTHEEFVWLHNQLEDNISYAGVILPPCPPRPDFDASRAKLQRLAEGDGNMTKEDLQKMKAELEA